MDARRFGKKTQRRNGPLARQIYRFARYDQISVSDIFKALAFGTKDGVNVLLQIEPKAGPTAV